MNKKWLSAFHAYDIRGVYGEDIDDEFVKALAHSFCRYLNKEGANVSLAYDVRENSKKLYFELIRELRTLGCNVHPLGLVATPQFYFSVAHYRLDGGIMVTASHNPPSYVGFKLCGNGGLIIGESEGMEAIRDGMLSGPTKPSSRPGRIRPLNVHRSYISRVKNFIGIRKAHRIVVDIGNGAAYRIVPELCSAFGIKCSLLFPEPDGSFKNRPSEPTDETIKALKAEVVAQKAEAGFAFDGDGDRVVAVDGSGRTLPGDVLFLLIAHSYKGKAKKAIIEVNFSSAVEDMLKALGMEVIVSRVGHSFITNSMKREDADLGGEVSGHYYFKDMYGLDDAEFAFLKSIEGMETIGDLSSWVSSLRLPPASPVVSIDVREDLKDKVMEYVRARLAEQSKRIITVDGVKAYFNDGWVLVRKSNTMPQIKIRAEGDGNERLLSMAKGIIEDALSQLSKA